ncbi:MAG TPA: GntR family transcriptional regulator [Xanthobacteraceae bacterium]|nr:GntR family transcriptional regulator [Xanthobacteraceae bacterium]
MTTTEHSPKKWSPPTERRATLHESLVDQLIEMIQEGELPPGSHVPEVTLCNHFGVSRTPMREALKVLAANGWVVWRANYGARVSEVDAQETASVFETLGGFELLIGRHLVERIPDAELAALEAMHAELIRHHAQGDRIGYFRLNQAIHARMARGLNNPVLLDLYETLSRKIYRARTMANYGPERWLESMQEHDAFMQALRARDGTRLAALLEAHNAATCAVVIAELLKAKQQGWADEN